MIWHFVTFSRQLILRPPAFANRIRIPQNVLHTSATEAAKFHYYSNRLKMMVTKTFLRKLTSCLLGLGDKTREAEKGNSPEWLGDDTQAVGARQEEILL